MNRLKALRTESNLSLRQLQSYVGVDFSRLAVIEKTDTGIGSRTLEKLLNFFGVNYSYFMGGDGLIDFYDEYENRYFPIAFGQFKDILDNAVVTISIAENKIRRVLSDEDLSRIENRMRGGAGALNSRITVERFISELEKMDYADYQSAKSLLEDYFSTH